MRDERSAANQSLEVQQGVTLLPFDDETLVYCEDNRRLVRLNRTSAFVFQEIRRGTPRDDLPAMLVSAALAVPENAQQWAETAIEVLRTQELLQKSCRGKSELNGVPPANRLRALRVEKMPPYTAIGDAIERYYQLLNTVALIRFEHPAQLRLVDSVLGHLARIDDAPPTVVIEIQGFLTSNGQHLRSRVYRDGAAINSIPRLSQLAPFVKAALWQSAVNAYDFQFYLHAGVVGKGDSCVLFPASAGSGKSSLTTALIHSGYHYFSDEVALVSRGSYLVPPAPLAICSKSTGWDVMRRYYPNLMSLPVHKRDDDKLVRYISPPADSRARQPTAVSHIIFPRYAAGSTSTLRKIGRADALEMLMAECIAAREDFSLADAQDLLRWVAQIDCYRLTFSSLDDAVNLVREVVPPPR